MTLLGGQAQIKSIQLSFTHKDTAQGTQSPLLRAFLAFRWFFMAIRFIGGSTGVSNIMIQFCMPIAHVCSLTLHQSSDRSLLSVWRPQSHQNQEVPERITQWETVTIGNQLLITLARIKLTETNNILRVRLTWLIL